MAGNRAPETGNGGSEVTAIAAGPAAAGNYGPAAASGMDRATDVPPADDARRSGLSRARTAGPAAADRSPAASSSRRTARSWPLLVLAAPAAAEVWSGWVGIAQKTGFGLVSPLPGIYPSLHLDTSITLPIGVEAYAAYALRAWLASEPWVSRRTRRFAKWSAICSFGLGMAGQVAYHLLEQAGAARAPWAITTIVSCLPVLVLAMGTTLAHMLRADAATADAADAGTGGPAIHRSPDRSPEDQVRPDHQTTGAGPAVRSCRPADDRRPPRPDQDPAVQTTAPPCGSARPETGQARLIAHRLAAAGKPVSRRPLRTGGVKGSNEALNALARQVNAELAVAASPPPGLDDVISAHAGMARGRTYPAEEEKNGPEAVRAASLAGTAGLSSQQAPARGPEGKQ